MLAASISSDNTDLAEELKRNISGEVRFDKMSRVLYSTDASIYQIEPIGVVIPKTEEDVIAAVETASKYSVPILPRGGGTSLAGQTVGHAVVVDFSKYMRNVLEINSEEGWVKVQPGIILDELNDQIKHTGSFFSPDPSTSNRSNVGGALGNNSCGAHSIVWGKTSDNVLGLQAILSDGSKTSMDTLTRNQMRQKMQLDNLEGKIYRTLDNVAGSTREEVETKYPKILRRVGGYNLDHLMSTDYIDMAKFVVGSEGTLLTITEATLKIIPRPKHKGLAVIHFNELIQSMEATVTILEFRPSAVELIDNMIIKQARTNLEYSRMMDFIEGDPKAILLVEFTGDSETEIDSKMDRLEKRINRSRLSYAIRRILKPREQAKVWAFRKAGLGLMMNVKGGAKPLPFVEDTAVAPESLPDYVKKFDEVIKRNDTTAGYYGHASVGCLHIRPLIDLKLTEGVNRMVNIASQISDLVLEFGGAMTGEHGDGLVRSVWNEKMYGTVIYNAFREVKRAFDPKGIMNPGKIVDSPPMTENLRTGPGYSTVAPKTSLSFSTEGGFSDAIEMCNGQGACRKISSGTMCPSYIATRDEEHSTRGRANALRASISGVLPPSALTDKRLREVLDLCLECKGCKSECPTNVDMAKLKYEFLNDYYRRNKRAFRDIIFGNISQLSRLGSFFAPISNWCIGSLVAKELLDELVGIDKNRTLPSFAGQSFVQWYKARGGSPSTKYTKGQVLLFPDTFTNYNHPNLGKAATTVLEKIGYQVIIPPTKCCGRPMLSKGMINSAQTNARTNVDAVFPYLQKGAKLVGIEPSCILSFRDDYMDLLDGDPKVQTVAKNSMLVEEFVSEAIQNDGIDTLFGDGPGRVLFHGHCHQKALVGTGQAMNILNSIPGCDAEEVPSGCCGMAGAFGFEKEHYQISVAIGEQVLLPAIRAQKGEFTVVSDGVSCRQQIKDGTGVRAKHLVEILAETLV